MNNYEMMRKRLEFHGGIHQEDRMIRDKYKAFQKALLHSYQAASAVRVQECSTCLDFGSDEPRIPAGSEARVLINPDKVKQDYDEKILSISDDYGWKPGDVFKWMKTDSYWIIYLREITEDAYFRGGIRRCKYRIHFKGTDGKRYSTWAAIRGPVETQIDSIQKNQERIDLPNLSLNILIPRNKETVAMFERYKEFLFQGRCWRVEAPDAISMYDSINGEDCGVLEIAAEEDFSNPVTDDRKKEIRDGLIIEPIDPTPRTHIEGKTFIKPKLEEIYSVKERGGTWSVQKCRPVILIPIDDRRVKVRWDKSVSGQFDLYWTKDQKKFVKTIVVESLF